MTEKVTVPYSLEAETALLGSLFIDPAAYNQIAGIVDASQFYLQKHRWIFTAIKHMKEAGEPVDFATMIYEMERREQLEAIGGASYLAQLANSVPSALNIASYARIVVDTHKRRETLDLVSEIAKVAYNEAEDMSAVSGYFQDRIADLFATKELQRTWQPFSEIAPHIPKVSWLWPDWIPIGMITVLAGTSAAGKSAVAMDWCKVITNGLAFPNSPTRNPPGNVVYIDAEYIPEIIKERSEWWGLDLTRFYVMQANANDLIDLDRREYREKLRSMIASIKPRMVVLDSLGSATSNGENAKEDVRNLMGFLAEIANTYRTAMVVLHHIRKEGNRAIARPEVSKDDVRGSGHITAMARSVIGMWIVQTGPDPDLNGPRKLSVIKANSSQYPDPLGCDFLPRAPEGFFISWNQSAPKAYQAPTKLEECARFLENLLKDTGEPLSPKEIIAMAREEGFSRDLVFQARKTLGSHVKNTSGYKDPSNQWEWVN